MFKHFVTQYNPISIVSYSDIAKFTGNSYEKLGFTTSLKNITHPNYAWVHPKELKVLSRYQTQKSILIKNNLGSKEETENEIMERQGFYKIYGSGNLKFDWVK